MFLFYDKYSLKYTWKSSFFQYLNFRFCNENIWLMKGRSCHTTAFACHLCTCLCHLCPCCLLLCPCCLLLCPHLLCLFLCLCFSITSKDWMLLFRFNTSPIMALCIISEPSLSMWRLLLRLNRYFCHFNVIEPKTHK